MDKPKHWFKNAVQHFLYQALAGCKSEMPEGTITEADRAEMILTLVLLVGAHFRNNLTPLEAKVLATAAFDQFVAGQPCVYTPVETAADVLEKLLKAGKSIVVID